MASAAFALIQLMKDPCRGKGKRRGRKLSSRGAADGKRGVRDADKTIKRPRNFEIGSQALRGAMFFSNASYEQTVKPTQDPKEMLSILPLPFAAGCFTIRWKAITQSIDLLCGRYDGRERQSIFSNAFCGC